MSKGQFITIEGTEGAGKTTCLNLVKGLIRDAGHQVLITREPGGTSLGEDLRGLLLSHRDEHMSADTELLLMFAARAEHLDKVILPALSDGTWVISDRFTDATYAYQGGGRGISHQRISQLEDWVQQGLKPDLTLLMDLPVKAGLERASKRSDPDRFESEKIQFFEQIRSAYLTLAEAEPDRFRVINASLSLEQVSQSIHESISGYLTNV